MVRRSRTGHIAGSLHVPQKELEANIVNLVTDREKKVVVVVGATQGAEIESIHESLSGLGYKNIEFLTGGFGRVANQMAIPMIASRRKLPPMTLAVCCSQNVGGISA